MFGSEGVVEDIPLHLVVVPVPWQCLWKAQRERQKERGERHSVDAVFRPRSMTTDKHLNTNDSC